MRFVLKCDEDVGQEQLALDPDVALRELHVEPLRFGEWGFEAATLKYTGDQLAMTNALKNVCALPKC